MIVVSALVNFAFVFNTCTVSIGTHKEVGISLGILLAHSMASALYFFASVGFLVAKFFGTTVFGKAAIDFLADVAQALVSTVVQGHTVFM